jgi:hypothetical protein
MLKHLISVALLGTLLCAPASAALITFSELSNRPADGVSLFGVTFDFKISGVDSTDARFNAGGPGVTTYTSDPGLEGNLAGVLAMDFSSSVGFLQFGTAISVNLPNDALTVRLFDGNTLVSTTIMDLALGGYSFPSGQFTYNGSGIDRAELDFNVSSGRFLVDNVRFDSVPDSGSSGMSLVVGVLFLFALRLRRRSA